jgi:hypothetical protein
MIEVQLPTLHPDQVQAYKLQGRFKAIRCGRRWGKTALAQVVACDAAIKRQSVGIFAPDYKILAETFNEMVYILEPVKSASSKVEGIIRTITGGRIDFWTLENERAGRSRKYHKVIIDEAAFTKPSMMGVWEKSIKPTLLDYGGTAIALSNTNGNDSENFFWRICNQPQYGFVEFHAPTHNNPFMPADELERLKTDNHPLVYRQEYLAEFVDWSSAAFFTFDKWLEAGQPIEAPDKCDAVYAVIDSATKTGREHDGTAVIYFLRNKYTLPKLVILDWEILQIEGALLEVWLPQVFQNLEALALKHGAREGSLGAWIEDKSSGSVLLQKAEGRGWPAQAIDSRLTALGKDERAIGISGNHYRGEVKLSREAHDKVSTYKETTRNHLRGQVIGFRIGDKDANKREDDLLDCYCYGVELALGAQEWAK